MLKISFHPRRCVLAGLLVLVLPGCDTSRNNDSSYLHLQELPPPVPVGAAQGQFKSGISYRYYYDRNALKAARFIGKNIVVLTDAGHLLYFDRATLAWNGETIMESKIVCLSEGPGPLFAGFQDGQIARIDPDTLVLTNFFKAEATIRWLGSRQDGSLVVVARDVSDLDASGVLRRPSLPTRPQQPPANLKQGVAYWSLSDKASCWLLDRTGRLWFGEDRGEWGGGLWALNLKTGTILEVGSKEGVYGLTELPNGQVWACGGTSHLGLGSAFISRVDRGKHEKLRPRPAEGRQFSLEVLAQWDEGPFMGAQPFSHIRPLSDGFLLSRGNRLLRTNRTLGEIDSNVLVSARSWPGRPDAMGSYPAIREVHVLDKKGSEVLLVTARDGLIRISGQQIFSRALPEQLEANLGLNRIETTAAGLLLCESFDRALPWRRGPLGWEQVTMNLEADERIKNHPWSTFRFMGLHHGELLAFMAKDPPSNQWVIGAWKDGRMTRWLHEKSSRTRSDPFNSPDGELWIVEDKRQLKRYLDGQWRVVGQVTEFDGFSFGWKNLSRKEPPWIFLDYRTDSLFRLIPETPERAASLERITPPNLKVFDGLHGAANEVLLATSNGLQRLDLDSGTLSTVPILVPNDEIRCLAKDGANRLWMAGRRVWLLDNPAGPARNFGELPADREGTITALAADPEDRAGIVALEDAGVIFLHAGE